MLIYPHRSDKAVADAALTLRRGRLRLAISRSTHELSRAGLIKGFHPTQCLVENAQLIFAPVRFSGDGAKFAVVISRSRRPDLVGDGRIDGEHDRRDPAFLDHAGNDAESLMTKPRGRDKQCGRESHTDADARRALEPSSSATREAFGMWLLMLHQTLFSPPMHGVCLVFA